MKEPDRETIYTAALLACGMPPRPKREGYRKKRDNYLHLANHIVYTGLRDWIESEAHDSFQRSKIWGMEKQKFYNWLADRRMEAKRQ